VLLALFSVKIWSKIFCEKPNGKTPFEDLCQCLSIFARAKLVNGFQQENERKEGNDEHLTPNVLDSVGPAYQISRYVPMAFIAEPSF